MQSNASFLSYRVERTNNRNSRAVLRNDEVIIRLARGLHAVEQERHIQVLLKKMAQAKTKEALRVAIDPFRPILHGETELSMVPIVGDLLHFRIEEGKTLSAKNMNGYWRISRPDHTKGLHRLLWRVLSQHARASLEQMVRTINDRTFCSSIRSVSLKFMRSRWGSCSMGGSIALSTPLLYTDMDILRYVIVHELAHTHHPDHSSAFWEAVEQHEPGYEVAFKRLKSYRMPQV